MEVRAGALYQSAGMLPAHTWGSLGKVVMHGDARLNSCCKEHVIYVVELVINSLHLLISPVSWLFGTRKVIKFVMLLIGGKLPDSLFWPCSSCKLTFNDLLMPSPELHQKL